MSRPRRPAPLAPFLALLALTAVASPVRGQTLGSWQVMAGAGAALDLRGHSGNDAAAVGWGTQAALTRRIGDGVRLGFQWNAAWFSGAPADEQRHQVALVWAWTRGDFLLRLGPGLGMATRVEIDSPPRSGPAGDALVTVGSESALGFATGVGVRLNVAPWMVVEPAADLVAQRVAGRTIATLFAGGRVQFGLRGRG